MVHPERLASAETELYYQVLHVARAPVPVVPAGFECGCYPDPVEGLVHASDIPGVDVQGLRFFVHHSEPVLVFRSAEFDRVPLSPIEGLSTVISPEVLSLVPLLEVDRPTGPGLPGVYPDTVLPVPSELPEPEESPVQFVLDVALLDADRETVVEAIIYPGLPTDVPHGAPVGLHPADPAP